MAQAATMESDEVWKRWECRLRRGQLGNQDKEEALKVVSFTSYLSSCILF